MSFTWIHLGFIVELKVYEMEVYERFTNVYH